MDLEPEPEAEPEPELEREPEPEPEPDLEAGDESEGVRLPKPTGDCREGGPHLTNHFFPYHL